MKTTSYKISKQLQKNGLSKLNGESKLSFMEYYYKTDKQLRHRNQEPYCSTDKENTQVDCFAYDLETILEALSDSIHDKENCSSEESLELTKDYIQYSSTLSFNYYRVDKQENESLADTAARMWLKLKKMGLV